MPRRCLDPRCPCRVFGGRGWCQPGTPIPAGDHRSPEQLSDEKIGPSLGSELRTKALIALGLAVAAQLVYLAVRFDWRLGVATVVALSQDVLLVLVALLLLGDGSLADFALALLLGLIIGTVSTVATAGPVAILLEKKYPGAGRTTSPRTRHPDVRKGSGAVV